MRSHAAVALTSNRILVHGGSGERENPLADMFIFSITSPCNGKWESYPVEGECHVHSHQIHKFGPLLVMKLMTSQYNFTSFLAKRIAEDVIELTLKPLLWEPK